MQVSRWINGRDPRQYGFDFRLWTREAVAQLIEDKVGGRLSLASVGTAGRPLGKDEVLQDNIEAEMLAIQRPLVLSGRSSKLRMQPILLTG